MLVHFLFDQTQCVKRALAVATILHGNCLKRALALLQTYNSSGVFFLFYLFIYFASLYFMCNFIT